MSLGSQVEKYRKAAGLTYDGLADLSDVGTGTINALEKRASVRSAHGSALAKAFGLTLDQLLDETMDFTEQVKAYVAQSLASQGARPGATAIERRLDASIANYWPFSVVPARMKASLQPDDLQRIDAYILALIEANEASTRPPGAIEEPRQGNGRP